MSISVPATTKSPDRFGDRPSLWPPDHPSPPKAVLDTNVLLDIFTCADLADEYQRPDADVASEKSIYRRARARESLVLAIHLHETASPTWSLPNESTTHVTRRAPPDQPSDPKHHFTWVFVNYVKDSALHGWDARLSTSGDEGLKGAACDDYLVHVASLNKVPLITNEGSSVTGVNDTHGIRKKALKAGVRVFTPREFWKGQINPRRASRRFIKLYRSGARRFMRRYGNSRTLYDVMQWIDGYFHHVLYGIAADGTSRLQIEVTGAAAYE